MSYTKLSITEAIELVKAGCKDVWQFLVEDNEWYRIHPNVAFFIYSKYRIEETLLNDFKKDKV